MSLPDQDARDDRGRTPQILPESLADLWQVRKRSVPISGTDLTLNPNLVFNETLVAGDIEYKLAGDWVRAADIYQVVTFAEGVSDHFRFSCVRYR